MDVHWIVLEPLCITPCANIYFYSFALLNCKSNRIIALNVITGWKFDLYDEWIMINALFTLKEPLLHSKKQMTLDISWRGQCEDETSLYREEIFLLTISRNSLRMIFASVTCCYYLETSSPWLNLIVITKKKCKMIINSRQEENSRLKSDRLSWTDQTKMYLFFQGQW